MCRALLQQHPPHQRRVVLRAPPAQQRRSVEPSETKNIASDCGENLTLTPWGCSRIPTSISIRRTSFKKLNDSVSSTRAAEKRSRKGKEGDERSDGLLQCMCHGAQTGWHCGAARPSQLAAGKHFVAGLLAHWRCDDDDNATRRRQDFLSFFRPPPPPPPLIVAGLVLSRGKVAGT